MQAAQAARVLLRAVRVLRDPMRSGHIPVQAAVVQGPAGRVLMLLHLLPAQAVLRMEAMAVQAFPEVQQGQETMHPPYYPAVAGEVPEILQLQGTD